MAGAGTLVASCRGAMSSPQHASVCATDRRQTIVRLLSGTELFGALSPADLASCAAKFRLVRFEKGEVLFARGDAGEHLYLVESGQVRLATANGDGRELSFLIAAAGVVFGEISVFDGGPRSAEATALTPVKAYSLHRSDFRELSGAHPAISAAAVSFLCNRLRISNDKLEAIALYPMEVRLARFLLKALGNRQSPSGRRVPLELGYSQGELALLLGASRPKINGALATLEHAGAIGRTLDRLFCDPVKLVHIAQVEPSVRSSG